jgi:hypothetical protein
MVRSSVLQVLSVCLALIGSVALTCQSQAQSQPPRIFYTDITSGPSSGGQNGQGAFITIYGNNFGSTRGTSVVTLNGAAGVSYPFWTNTKVTVQIGSAAASGNLVVKVGGASSNGVAFTVRAGRIYFVSTSGNDSNSGSYSSPWATLLKARTQATAGDIVYALNGVQQTGADLTSASLAVSKSGTSTSPIAFIAYPNAKVTIGTTTGQTYGIRSASTSWIVLAGMTVRGALTAVDLTSSYNWRIVGNDISCPNGSGVGGCVDGSAVGGSKVYGNNVHDTGSTSSSNISQYSGLNFVNTSSLDVGWNTVGNTRGCDAVKVRSSSQLNYGVKIHDNSVHDARCSGVVVGNMDTTKGTVKVYNNVLARTGTGPAPGGVESEAYAGVYVANSSDGVLITNNTLYDCGARKNTNSGCVLTDSSATLQDNILYGTTGERYVALGSSRTPTGNNNLCYGTGSACPSSLTASISANPLFTSISTGDYRLQTGSPAIDKGVSTGTGLDMVGTARPKGAAYDIGAYEAVSTSGPVIGVNLTASPASLSFGSVTVGQSLTLSGTLTNSSTTTSITLTAANISGTGFSISNLTLPKTITPGGNVTYTAKFAPSLSGTGTGSISFVSDATNSPLGVTLSGSGTTVTTPHSISLSWTKSTSTGVSGYNVYRSTVSGGSYTKINSSLDTGTTYTDNNVTSGSKYYYVVRSVSSTGAESGNSAQTSATIP